VHEAPGEARVGTRVQDSKGQSPKDLVSRDKFANRKETITGTPDKVALTEGDEEVDVPQGTVHAEDRHVGVTTNLTNGTKSGYRKLALSVLVFLAEGEDVFNTCNFPWFVLVVNLNQPDRVFRRDVAIEVKDLPLILNDTLALDRETLGSDVPVGQVVMTGSDHDIQSFIEIDSEDVWTRNDLAQTEKLAKASAIRNTSLNRGLRNVGKTTAFENADLKDVAGNALFIKLGVGFDQL